MMLSAALVLSALLVPWDYSRFGSRVHVVSVKGSIPESDVLAPLWPCCGAEQEVAKFINPAALCSQERGRKRRSGAHRGRAGWREAEGQRTAEQLDTFQFWSANRPEPCPSLGRTTDTDMLQPKRQGSLERRRQ